MCFGASAQQGGYGGGSPGPFQPTGWQPNYGLGNLATWFAPPMSSSYGAPTSQAPTPPAPAPQTPAMSPAPNPSSSPPWMSQLPPQLQSMFQSGAAQDFPTLMNSLMSWWQTQGQGGQAQTNPQAGATPTAPSTTPQTAAPAASPALVPPPSTPTPLSPAPITDPTMTGSVPVNNPGQAVPSSVGSLLAPQSVPAGNTGGVAGTVPILGGSLANVPGGNLLGTIFGASSWGRA